MTLLPSTLTAALSLNGRGSWLAVLLAFVLFPSSGVADDALVEALQKLDATVLPASTPQEKQATQRMLADHASALLKAANIASTNEWRKIKTREEWDAFRKAKLELLRKSVAQFPPVPEKIEIHTSKVFDGEGFKVHNIAFATRPHFYVTANLYVPHPAPGEIGSPGGPTSAPGIIIQPSHHNPKTNGELQDMGMTWARAGCYVLVADQVGHGERRAHPFAKDADYAGSFRVSRQDYWFRYNTGMQLHLIGDSLIGWQAWDLMRGVDVLLQQKNIDPKRIVIMGSVAGGGDPAAVTAALDERITCSVIFNFGGPQPESKYPLPDDAEDSFGYAGSGSFESTRNISFTCRDGTLPWVIVGSIAPRRHIHAHEFSWDRERDPVWKRFDTIYGWYGAKENLTFAHGFGLLREEPPKASHCGNIGPPHRKHIYAALEKWFAIPTPKEEYTKRRPGEELLVMTPELSAKLAPWPLHEVARNAADIKLISLRAKLNDLPSDWARGKSLGAARRDVMRKRLVDILGPVDRLAPDTRARDVTPAKMGDHAVRRFYVEPEKGICLPTILILPRDTTQPPPVVVMFAQAGKAALLQKRAAEIATLLAAGFAVCLPDLRGTGETRLDSGRGRQSWDTDVSSTFLMLGKPLLGQRVTDVLVVARTLQEDLAMPKVGRVALWGDSLAPVNAEERNIAVPFGVSDAPATGEPMGAMVALLAGVFSDNIAAVYTRGGLLSFDSVLGNQFVHLPHDLIVPGQMLAGDVVDWMQGLLDKPVWIEEFIDGGNKRVWQKEPLREFFEERPTGHNGYLTRHLLVGEKVSPTDEIVVWHQKSCMPK